ncbi:uncharacterized protein LOC143027768 [Oratosquilla oratoria]|uniref:uncharacterized protein LOC143027768 n=1 Tax=Oratosquilla oratoria TaxID=337810 RepID=UPI003F7594D6
MATTLSSTALVHCVILKTPGDPSKVKSSCGSSSNRNNTYFVSPGYPSPDTKTGTCTHTVVRSSNNICQLRLDLVPMNVNGPDANGLCATDFLTVTGGTSNVPMICGANANQHMYVDLDPSGGAIKVQVDRAGAAAAGADRSWNIKIAQIPCNSRNRAPTGCLQYFTTTSGTVSSFNYQTTSPKAADNTPGTHQLANHDYSICIEPAAGYCGIQWFPDPEAKENAFLLTGTTVGVDPDLVGYKGKNMHRREGDVPIEWKLPDVTPTFKNDNKQNLQNYTSEVRRYKVKRARKKAKVFSIVCVHQRKQKTEKGFQVYG